LAVLLAAPFSGIAGRVYEVACVLLFFPALIFWGAEARESHKGVGAALGDTSYALYVIHYPLVVLMGRLLAQSGTGFAPLLELPFLVGLAALAYGLHHIFDEPLRGWLTRHRARYALTHSPV
jgi:peptidoglycan/LPS O-acetylase OafA/YrhL